ncbi:MAG: hypothetical protein RR238_07950 [Lachnospiraceae bacterium]
MGSKDIALIGMMVATIEAAKVSLSFLPNIELVSLLVILYTLFFKRKAVYAIFIFILMEGFLYGFGIWWFGYLYVWPILAFITHLCRQHTEPMFWATLSGFYGLVFGGLFAIPYFFLSGYQAGMTYWISGIPYDIAHCIGNFTLALVLFRPLYRILQKVSRMNHEI